ncbi:Somatostatin receptor type 3 [Myotis brandtii]|uniref:Somatostatin receptor type 3 n=1 Tax=Myotis brandtii TaxID=109478 RepID=S7QB29_MYOBR|nr:PREDICTED: somatostatin receptor type 3 [Myotis brandtii]XP_005883291.1 PREDICTED: somatostatin receptor type 3 [Myotis brandtii]XP_014386346.1 PREDICTED: somatostatin receptor type 3 [Myotis brandtii]EPQ18317.1 Somatostatin receptor type 3 [Myotis brandtii]
MDPLGYPSPVPATSEPDNASAWLLDATLGNVSVAPSAAGLAVRGVLIPLVYLVVCVVGLLGNSLVIYVVLRHTASPSVTNVYILNLALADELFMLGLPFLAAQNALSYWPFGSLMCRLVMAVDGINQFTSIFCLTVMSVDRYLAVVHPTRSARWRTAPVARAVSAAVWVASAVVVLPVVVFSGVPRGMSTCHMQWPEPAAAWRAGFIIYTAALGFFGPLLVICLCYLLIVVKMRSAGRRVWAPSCQRRRRSERRVTRMVVAVVALFVLCWMPFYVLNIINVVCPLPEEPAFFGLYFLVVALPYANSCANPILYGFLSYRFKQGFRRVLLRPSRRVRSQEPPAGPPEKTEEEEEEEEDEDGEEGGEKGAGKQGEAKEMNGRVSQITQPGTSRQALPPSCVPGKEQQSLPQEPSAGERPGALHISCL